MLLGRTLRRGGGLRRDQRRAGIHHFRDSSCGNGAQHRGATQSLHDQRGLVRKRLLDLVVLPARGFLTTRGALLGIRRGLALEPDRQRLLVDDADPEKRRVAADLLRRRTRRAPAAGSDGGRL